MESSDLNPRDFWLSFGPTIEATTLPDTKRGASAKSSGTSLPEAKFRKSGLQAAEIPQITLDEYKPRRRKRIIICCDGTWQNAVIQERNVPSNVTRLTRSISRFGDDDLQQVVYYSPGIGTGDGVGFVEKVRQAIFGDGLVADIIKAYNFIVMNYTLGDEVMCFGFSRGAYTARSVAGLITDIGIVLPSEMHDFHDLYRVYRDHDHSRSENFRESDAYREWITGVQDGKSDHWILTPHRLPPDSTRIVKLVGVFDTVGALGIPGYTLPRAFTLFLKRYIRLAAVDDHRFHNHSLSRSLDEGGCSFAPTLWTLPEPVTRRGDGKLTLELQNTFQEALMESHANDMTVCRHWRRMIRSDEARTQAKRDEKKHRQNEKDEKGKKGKNDDDLDLRQVWFPGSHINIGGGNPAIHMGFPYDYEQLSLISLAWMCDQVRPYLKLDDTTSPGVDGTAKTLSTLADREMMQRRRLIQVVNYENKNKGLVRRLGARVVRLFTHRLHPYRQTTKDVAGAGWSTGPITDTLETMLKLVPFRPRWAARKPGKYDKKDQAGNRKGETCEEIHPSAAYRWKTLKKYRPDSLKRFERVRETIRGDGEVVKFLYRWTAGTVTLREYLIRPTDTVTRGLASYSEGGDAFVKDLVKKAS